MKIAGHTMGTPELSLEGAVGLFSEIGLDAVEIVCQNGYKCGFSPDISPSEVAVIKKHIDKAGLIVSCLTPYASDFNALDETNRAKSVNEIMNCLKIAAMLECPNIRIYGGTLLAGDTVNIGEKRRILVETLGKLGDAAQNDCIRLVVENHFNTMTTTAENTQAIIEAINHPAVKILYDQANLAFIKGENFQEAIRIQGQNIAYVHVKDLVFKNAAAEFKASDVTHVSEEERVVRSRIPGEGILPWPEIIERLSRSGYQGYLSLEYERRWHPDDLPVAAEGMKKGAEYLRGILDKLGL
jgi:L-ribulose-5-phosphate 3-epimerase